MKDEPTTAEKSARVMIRQGYGRSALVGDINIECRPDQSISPSVRGLIGGCRHRAAMPFKFRHPA